MPRLKACKYCGRIHRSDIRCSALPRRKKEPTEISKLRDAADWKKTRKAAYERDHYLCRLCLLEKRLTCEDLEAHHIVPLREDPELAYELDNTITLCAAHHKEADRGRPDRGVLRNIILDQADFLL